VSVGCRVLDSDGFKATIRYIGTVAGTKKVDEVWFGVEWDDLSRGKHDGCSVDTSGVLHKYFECAPGSGSFIRPSKVSYGRTLLEALNDRYVSLDAPTIADADANIPDVYVNTLKGNQKSIQFVGEEKIRKRQQLAIVSTVAIRNDIISRIDPGSCCASIAHLVEIDLQDNLLWRWSDIATLGSEVPNLGVLLLHGNKMQPITESVCFGFPPGCFNRLRVLALNFCGIKSWASVQRLEVHLPNVEELYLEGNSLPDLPRANAEQIYQDATGCGKVTGTTAAAGAEIQAGEESSKKLQQQQVGDVSGDAAAAVQVVVTGFASLRLLDISACGLDEWSQVAVFGKLPRLQELILDSNPLPQVLAPTDDNTFRTLYRFSLASTGIARWQDINRLAAYPHLQVVRLSQIPLFVGRGSSEVRPEVIARIPQLTFFNGSVVGPRERTEAEKNYLRSIHFQRVVVGTSASSANSLPAAPPPPTTTTTTTTSSSSSSSSSSSLPGEATATVPPPQPSTAEEPAIDVVGIDLELHPRYIALMKAYGADLVPISRASTGPMSMASELISVTFNNLSFIGNGSLEPVTKKLPRSLLISRLQMMVKAMFGLEPRLQQLSLRVHRDAPPVLLDDDKATLQYYGAVDGADIFVNEAKDE